MDPEPSPKFFILLLVLCSFCPSVSNSIGLNGPCANGLHVQAESNRPPFRSVGAEEFFTTVSNLPPMRYLRSRSLDEYFQITKNNGFLFLNDDSTIGYGVTKDGLLISVFNNSRTKGRGAEAVNDAVRRSGATSLICVGVPDLKTYYESFGFVVVDSFPMKPENAGYDLDWPDERPPMLRMVLEPKQ
jgi:hypothetical protein